MASIEQLSRLDSENLPLAANNTLQNKQAWLRSLEKAGLYDAVKQAKVIKATESETGAAQPDTFKEVKPNLARQSGLDISPRPGNEDFDQEKPSESAHENAQGAYIQNEEPMELVYNPGTPMATIAENALTTDEAGLPIMARLTSLDLESLKYPWRNMFMKSSGSDIELWIRDANLSQSKLDSALKALRQSMSTVGASLVRVVLNGQEVFSARQAEPMQALSIKG